MKTALAILHSVRIPPQYLLVISGILAGFPALLAAQSRPGILEDCFRQIPNDLAANEFISHSSGAEISAIRVLTARAYGEAFQYDGTVNMEISLDNDEAGSAVFVCSNAEPDWDYTIPSNLLSCEQMMISREETCEPGSTISVAFTSDPGIREMQIVFEAFDLSSLMSNSEPDLLVCNQMGRITANGAGPVTLNFTAHYPENCDDMY